MADEDMTLETLLAVHTEVSPGLDESLLRQCYLVQKRFQFSADRTVSASNMERLIDEQVKKLSGEAQEQP